MNWRLYQRRPTQVGARAICDSCGKDNFQMFENKINRKRIIIYLKCLHCNKWYGKTGGLRK